MEAGEPKYVGYTIGAKANAVASKYSIWGARFFTDLAGFLLICVSLSLGSVSLRHLCWDGIPESPQRTHTIRLLPIHGRE